MAKKTQKYQTYTTYVFRAKEQDPVVDKLRTLYEEAGSPPLTRVSGGTRLSVSTLANWGVNRRTTWKTRKPQHATVAAFAGYFGKEFVLADKKVRR